MLGNIYFFSDGHKVRTRPAARLTSTPKANGYRALHLTGHGTWTENGSRSRYEAGRWM